MNGLREATGEAAGRLDFLGGVADYSGALVLQTPTQASTRVRVRALLENYLRLETPSDGVFQMDCAPLRRALAAGVS